VRCAAFCALLVALVGCSSSHDTELDGARDQVQRFFDAIGKSDCPTLELLVPAAREPGACDHLVHEWRDELHIKLLDVPDVRRDGRDRKAIIVKTIVLRHDQQQTMLVRVTHEQGEWQLQL